jgi:hypothetical protein
MKREFVGFKLPVEIINYIDNTAGANRTEKLIGLLGFGVKLEVKSNVNHDCVSDAGAKFDELEKRIFALEQSAISNQIDSFAKVKQALSNITEQPPTLKPIKGVISHADHKTEIDKYVMALLIKGHAMAQIADHLNALGWITQKHAPWDKSSIYSIKKRITRTLKV